MVVKLGNFLDIVHFFAYRNHILLIFKHRYKSGQCLTPTKNDFAGRFLFSAILQILDGRPSQL